MLFNKSVLNCPEKMCLGKVLKVRIIEPGPRCFKEISSAFDLGLVGSVTD